jgi:hypothetical protein
MTGAYNGPPTQITGGLNNFAGRLQLYTRNNSITSTTTWQYGNSGANCTLDVYFGTSVITAPSGLNSTQNTSGVVRLSKGSSKWIIAGNINLLLNEILLDDTSRTVTYGSNVRAIKSFGKRFYTFVDSCATGARDSLLDNQYCVDGRYIKLGKFKINGMTDTVGNFWRWENTNSDTLFGNVTGSKIVTTGANATVLLQGTGKRLTDSITIVPIQNLTMTLDSATSFKSFAPVRASAAQRWTLQANKTMTLSDVSDYALSGQGGTVDSLISSTPGTYARVALPTSIKDSMTYFKDIAAVGAAWVCTTGTAINGGNDSNFVWDSLVISARSPATINSGGGLCTLTTIHGRTSGGSATVGGTSATIVEQTPTRVILSLPAKPAGTYDLVFQSSLGLDPGDDTVSVTFAASTPGPLTYVTSPLVCLSKAAIARDSCVNAGGAADSFTVTPALPSGLSITSAYGTIYGTATVPQAQASYKVYAWYEGAKADSVSLPISVSGPTPLSYVTSPLVCTLNVAIVRDSLVNGGGNADSFTIAPTLPTGISFSSTTGALFGTATAAQGATAYKTYSWINGAKFDSVSITISAVFVNVTRKWISTGSTNMNLATNYTGSGALQTTDNLVFFDTSVVNAIATANLSVNSITVQASYTGNWKDGGYTITTATGESFDGATAADTVTLTGKHIVTGDGNFTLSLGPYYAITAAACTLDVRGNDTIRNNGAAATTFKNITGAYPGKRTVNLSDSNLTTRQWTLMGGVWDQRESFLTTCTDSLDLQFSGSDSVRLSVASTTYIRYLQSSGRKKLYVPKMYMWMDTVGVDHNLMFINLDACTLDLHMSGPVTQLSHTIRYFTNSGPMNVYTNGNNITGHILLFGTESATNPFSIHFGSSRVTAREYFGNRDIYYYNKAGGTTYYGDSATINMKQQHFTMGRYANWIPNKDTILLDSAINGSVFESAAWDTGARSDTLGHLIIRKGGNTTTSFTAPFGFLSMRLDSGKTLPLGRRLYSAGAFSLNNASQFIDTSCTLTVAGNLTTGSGVTLTNNASTFWRVIGCPTLTNNGITWPDYRSGCFAYSPTIKTDIKDIASSGLSVYDYGGTYDSVTSESALPSGYSLNKNTGAITGTPVDTQSITQYKMYVWYNADKADSTNISIRVLGSVVGAIRNFCIGLGFGF